MLLNQPLNESARLIWRARSSSLPAEALIADASVAEETLFVVSFSFQFYNIPFAELPALRKISQENRNSFVIDEDGSFLHWPHDDIHIDIDTLEYNTNPEYRNKADLKRLQHNRKFGITLKQLRNKAGLRQSDIPGLSARQVRRIENGETPITSGTLEKMSAALWKYGPLL